MGGHDFLDHMPFRMTFVMIAYVLREVMLCCRKCHMGGTERHVLLEVMFYLRVGIIGGHVLLFKMPYWDTCFTGGHILHDDLLYRGTSYMRTGLTGGYVL